MAAGSERAARWRAGPAPRQLRLALAMRGGVSLAVWIGGACAEIDALRLAGDPDAPPCLYGPLLDAAGFDGVEIDVMAGASAGGLNGALLASSLLYGVDFRAFRDVWLEVGGLRGLLGTRRERERPPASLLRGRYFHEQLRARLAEQLAARDRERPPASYVDLHLAVTATDPRAVAVTDDWAAWYAEESYRVGFRFRHNRYTSDFARDPLEPATDDVALAVADKLALAARASASFPAAFAPVAVRLRRPDQVGQRADPGDAEDLFGLFSDASRATAWVADGGVLDNIPVERAIESIAAAPASSATERWLLYLCPSPEEVTPGSEPSWPDTVPPHLLWTLKAVLRASGSRESILEDMAALRAHNERAGQYAAARDLLVGRLRAANDRDTAAALLEAGASPAAVATYEADGARRAAGRARALLEDPVSALGEDPFPSPMGWPLLRTGRWTRPLRERLETALRAAYRDALAGAAQASAPVDAAALGPAPVAWIARFLIAELRGLEALAGADAHGALGARKQDLYGVADAAALLAHLGDLFWPCHLDSDPPPTDEHGTPVAADLGPWADRAVAARGAFLAGAHDQARVPDGFTWLRDELRRRLAACGGGDAPSSLADSGNAVAWLWWRLADLVGAIAAAAEAVEIPGDDPGLEVAARVLRAVGAGDADPLRCLVAFEVVAAPLTRLSPTSPQAIRFARLAGTNPTPLRIPSVLTDGAVDVQAKLAGNALANFAAFYKRSWRANDWMWGRLDAVGTLLPVLLRPDELAPRVRAAGDGGTAFVTAVERSVTAPFPAPEFLSAQEEGDWDALFADLWEQRRSAVAAEVAALAADEGGSLDATLAVLTTRRHWEIVAEELPVVLSAVTADRAEALRSAAGLRGLLRRLRRASPGATDAPQLRTPSQLQAALEDYRVGLERITDDLGSDHLTRLLGDAALAAWAALRHAQGEGGPAVLRPVGVGLRGLRWSLLNVSPLRRVVGLKRPAPAPTRDE